MKKGKIYLWCEPTGEGSGEVKGSTPGGDVVGYAQAEDGEILVAHVSSSEAFSKSDIGFISNFKHEIYKEKYPEGFELFWEKPVHLAPNHFELRGKSAKGISGQALLKAYREDPLLKGCENGFKFSLSESVRILPLENMIGLVISMTLDAGGQWCKVRYFQNGKAEEAFFLEMELGKCEGQGEYQRLWGVNGKE